MNHLDWYYNEVNKRKNASEKHHIYCINQELKLLLQEIQHLINRQDYETESREANRFVQQSSIWDVGYINNMESGDVAFAQAILIMQILSGDAELIQQSKAIENQVEYAMRRLGNVHWETYTEYCNEVQKMKTHN